MLKNNNNREFTGDHCTKHLNGKNVEEKQQKSNWCLVMYAVLKSFIELSHVGH